MKSDTAGLLLAVGNDAFLLRTRAAVLRTAGFQVIEAQGCKEAKIAAGYFAFQAALLCHTLKLAEQDALTIDLIFCSKRKMLIMKLYRQECQPISLIASVRKLIDMDKAAYPVISIAPSYELA